MEEAVIFFLAVCIEFRNIQWHELEKGDTEHQTDVVAVGKVSTVRQPKTHETVLGLNQRCQGCKATPRP